MELNEQTKAPLASSVAASRDKVAARVRSRVNSRDLGYTRHSAKAKKRVVLNEAQMAAVHAGLSPAEEDEARVAVKSTDSVPTVERLEALRQQANGNPKNG